MVQHALHLRIMIDGLLALMLWTNMLSSLSQTGVNNNGRSLWPQQRRPSHQLPLIPLQFGLHDVRVGQRGTVSVVNWYPNGYPHYPTRTKPRPHPAPSPIPIPEPETLPQPDIFPTTRRPRPNPRDPRIPGRGEAFGKCNMMDQSELEQLFPGLFMTESDVIGLEHVLMKSTNQRRLEPPPLPERRITVAEMALSPPERASGCDCCVTELAYEVYKTVDIEGRSYPVLNFNQSYQFIPAGRCRTRAHCDAGQCIQRYRHHWIMVWNVTQSYWPPLQFAPYEVPSHCEWANVSPGK
ncbi:hypothetical protein ScPMuIL_018035 [Solemya velum]